VRPTTRYAKSGDYSIAYQIVGDGPLDLVLVPGFVSHVAQHTVEGCNHRLTVFVAVKIQERMRFQKVLCDLPVPAHIDSRVWIIAAVRLEGYRDRIRPGGVDEMGQRSDAVVDYAWSASITSTRARYER